MRAAGAAVTRVAAVDCGTNSVRLLVADVTAEGLTDLTRRTEIVRLGEGVDRTGRLSAGALRRTLAMLAEYAREIDRLGAERVRMVATSATRDAANRGDFLAGVRRTLGVSPEVISGRREAELSYLGATRELPSGAYLVADIGGGSTELVEGDASPRRAVSVDIGCVRLTERHLRDDPPTAAQIAAADADVAAALRRAGGTVALPTAAILVGLAGSVTTVAAIALGLERYDPVRIHGSRLSRAAVSDVSRHLLALSRRGRAALPVMHPGRVDVIGAGALILDRVMAAAGADEVVVSEHDILDGIAVLAAGEPAAGGEPVAGGELAVGPD